jgi:hypothetical protein
MTMQRSDYKCWNRALAEYCLLSKDNGNQAYLTVSPNILAAAWNQTQAEAVEAIQAEKSFVCAVREMYRSDVKLFGLSWLGRFGQDGLPLSIAFLGLSVLAALEMQEDEEHAAHDYYKRLTAVMQVEIGEVLRDEFKEALKTGWFQLQTWMEDNKQARLNLPERREGPFSIVNLPLSQAPLRRTDLRKLPAFFSQFQYPPHGLTSHKKLSRDLDGWRGNLTKQGQQALQDERRELVLAQVKQELAAWDGIVEEAGARQARMELWLAVDATGRKSKLRWLPRRGRGFPERFESNGRGFEAGDDGWYEAVGLSFNDGRLLRNDIYWTMSHTNRQLTLYRPQTPVIAFAECDFLSGYLSRCGLPLHLNCAVLCRLDFVEKVRDYLRRISDQDHSPAPLLEGWQLFRGVRPLRQLSFIEEDLKPIDVETETQILVVGGLRVGRRQWLAEGPPRILIAGERFAHEQPTINGSPVEFGEESELLDGGRLQHPGKYEVTIGRAQAVNIEIIPPQLAAELRQTAKENPDHSPTAFPQIVLPPGNWTLLGTYSHEVRRYNDSSFGGFIAQPPFRVVWAVNWRPSASPRVVCLTNPPPEPGVTRTLSPALSRQWIGAVLSAAQSSRIGCLTGIPAAELRACWRVYVAAAIHQQQEALRARRVRQ